MDDEKKDGVEEGAPEETLAEGENGAGEEGAQPVAAPDEEPVEDGDQGIEA